MSVTIDGPVFELWHQLVTHSPHCGKSGDLYQRWPDSLIWLYIEEAGNSSHFPCAIIEQILVMHKQEVRAMALCPKAGFEVKV